MKPMSDNHGGLPPKSSLSILVHPEELLQRTWVELFRAHHWASRRADQMLARRGLSMAQFDVLATLRQGEGISQQDLADRLLVTKGNVCGLVERMGARGLLERRPDPADRRANCLYLTAAGRSLLDQLLPEQHELIRDSLGSLSLTDLWALQDLLSRIGLDSMTNKPFAPGE